MIKWSFWAMALTGILLTSCDDTDDVEVDSGAFSIYDYVQIATGQTILYDNNGDVVSSLAEGDAFYGQDASYLKGASMNYVDNGDSTITDNNTGLMWEEIPIPSSLTYDEAVAYCENLVLAGYDDWRMPSLKELFSISDFGRGWPYLDTTYFKLATGIVDKSEQFWSSNRYVGVTTEGQDNAAFGVNHVTGHIKAYPAASVMEGDEGGPIGGGPQGDSGDAPGDEGDDVVVGTPPPGGVEGQVMDSPLAKHVRAVRGDVYGENDFKDNGDGTISDDGTGLMWSQNDSGEGLNWEDALAYAENAELGGYTDWRLPNVKELQGIVDYSYAPGATDVNNEGPAIDPIFSCTPIINEAGLDDYGYYWTGTSANFTKDEPYYYAWYVAFGRAVDGDGHDTHGAGAVRFDTKYEGGPLGEGGERYYNYVRLVRNMSE
ncbi:hypothetical protein JCM21142_210 [Saccharicrinis fermentans DSM 9555 = JCM 21142]|uniref:Lcl C-terminal domain-containing protein n=2 Tax=Saccharicrinis fermentans TaxID=982 RepID=W7Y257_9BACT|nr:hypothetical protein JCM21142_210 [Saccharicrinis fermentans DSM 9555 = JCM 21142]